MRANPKNIGLKMQRLFAKLLEKDNRGYTAIESVKLGQGGIDYVSGLFGIDPKTARRGLSELEVEENPASSRIRRKGRLISG